jgi:CheY-like chemotaxis protein
MGAAAARRIFLVRRVLVVEDDSSVRDLIMDMLGPETFVFEGVGNDREAYARLDGASNLDGLIVDVNLGAGTTGFDVARFARKRNPDLPVVYISGEPVEASFRAYGVPGSLFLAKPFTAEELEDALEVALG